MITVSVVFRGYFARVVKRKQLNLSLFQDACIADLVAQITPLFGTKAALADEAFITRDNVKVKVDTVLNDGDRLVFMIPVVGGG